MQKLIIDGDALIKQLHETSLGVQSRMAVETLIRRFALKTEASQETKEDKLIEAQLKHLETGSLLMETSEMFAEAVKVIRQWHGMGMPEAMEKQAWHIYFENSPEMRSIREFSEKCKKRLEDAE